LGFELSGFGQRGQTGGVCKRKDAIGGARQGEEVSNTSVHVREQAQFGNGSRTGAVWQRFANRRSLATVREQAQFGNGLHPRSRRRSASSMMKNWIGFRFQASVLDMWSASRPTVPTTTESPCHNSSPITGMRLLSLVRPYAPAVTEAVTQAPPLSQECLGSPICLYLPRPGSLPLLG